MEKKPKNYFVHPNISEAETLPGSFYSDEAVFEQMKEQIFTRSWHWMGDELSLLPTSNYAYPCTLLEGFLDEPIVLTKDEAGIIHAMSNVCTHRGNIVVQDAGKGQRLTCGYHGRSWTLDGQFRSMPEFREVKNFPRPCDHLHRFSMERIAHHLFVSFDPLFPFEEVNEVIDRYMGFMPLEDFVMKPKYSKTYEVRAHWALYCDNYLEGFHIPFVHSGLNEALDYGNYETRLFDHCNVQVGFSSSDELCFDLPSNHPDAGRSVAAYYFWIFPNMMFNFYPWGLSINIVEPIAIDQTRVRFISYVYDETKLEQGAGSGLDQVEIEDEAVVEGVHQGLKSRFYTTGRFSVTREQGVHHFHRLLVEFI